ncbi:pentatricopeptide repeat-containing protein At4g02750 [Cryptomeria japonica]|uniref:pentatricopeptide repeat-containing protein At4g02750 n=1 Tax=Cryptomeria japonica TaxID=3369 RepID=UPI0025AC0F35|nr:pentatricopeptide repeat-containing protein At4g02750 [Cryptomeria japonica]XP_057843037.1 pentatricopeptide repeat-containing protein At4g02750 [Cryptomeria japonica]XP_057843039.1 pentatricopeptide repeat-containing protein At4g02750 [Cryptomeria japonica]XP_057843040.1 pentatricopeptide repeat-containing protein At4g02750 [Cryptomeria japonica]
MALVPCSRAMSVILVGYHSGRSRIEININMHLKSNHTMSPTARINLNPKLRALCRENRLEEAVDIVLTTHNPPSDCNIYLQLLSTCIAKNAFSQGKQIHSLIIDRGFAFATLPFFQNNIINLYAKCGSLLFARKLFAEMTERDGFSWNVIIAAYRKHGYPHEALSLFHQMQLTDVQPNQFTFASILPACAKLRSLEKGKVIHQNIIESGFLSDVVIVGALVDMYAKCGSIYKARELFDKIPQRNIATWNAMIAGYAQRGILDEALKLFYEMPQRDVVSWNAVFVGYAQYGTLDEALRLFNEMPQRDVVSWNMMIARYARNGDFDKAFMLLKEMPQHDVVSWNAIIAGYTQNGPVEKALETFNQMKLVGVQPNQFTFASILPACAKIGALKLGIDIHQTIMERGFLSDVVVVSALIDMYAKCGIIQKARELFDKMPQRNVVTWNAMIAGCTQNGFLDDALELFNKMPRRDVISWNAMLTGYAQNGALNEALRIFNEMPRRDVVSWNAMIAGYAQNGRVETALETFKQMQLAGLKPNPATFASILSTCAKMGALKQGMEIHRSIVESGFFSDVVVASALVDMYAKCGIIHKAQKLFDKISQRNVISWNAMIAAYLQNGVFDEALKLFKAMPQRDVVSWNAMIAGFAQNGVLDEALQLFKEMPQRNVVSWTTMIAGCAQNGILDEAFRIFNEMPQRDVVSWNAMIAGYAQNGLVERALDTFKQMQLAGFEPDEFTFGSILPACAKMGALEQGMAIHKSIIVNGLLSDVVVASALVDMYAKCGSIKKARELFDKMSQRHAVSWNAMIAGYAMHGFHKDALNLFELMKNSGTYPNHVSFVCVLFACNHGGLVDIGCKYFNDINGSYCIMPTIDHYACMVDLLGRAGYLEQASNFIIKMAIKPAVVVWMSLLGSCRSHKNTVLGEFTATLLFELDPKNASPYILLSNIYAEMGKWDDVRKVRRLMKDKGTKKIPGCSWIEVHKMVHVFCAGDRSHPQTQEIYAKLENLSLEMKAAGYFPDSEQLLNDVEEEEKELFLGHHSEKLAIAFGLLNTSPGTTITVVKNLRVCVDCHTVVKFISKIVAREVVVRDANRFHHFKQGQCTCGDYW